MYLQPRAVATKVRLHGNCSLRPAVTRPCVAHCDSPARFANTSRLSLPLVTHVAAIYTSRCTALARRPDSCAATAVAACQAGQRSWPPPPASLSHPQSALQPLPPSPPLSIPSTQRWIDLPIHTVLNCLRINQLNNTPLNYTVALQGHVRPARPGRDCLLLRCIDCTLQLQGAHS
eukprot:COSAG02_NODE_1198_length_13931_cov_66.449754_9_plen_175_part_00